MKWKGDTRGMLEMRRHYSQYFKGLHDFKPYRMRLVTEPDPAVISSILDEIDQVYKDYQLE